MTRGLDGVARGVSRRAAHQSAPHRAGKCVREPFHRVHSELMPTPGRTSVSARHPLPVVFIGGLSGVGKTETAEWIAEHHRFIHLNIDRDDGLDGIDVFAIRREWDACHNDGEPTALAAAIRRMTRQRRASGAVLSFPSALIFDRALVENVRTAGITTILLSGRPEWCVRAFLERESRRARHLEEQHWHHYNDLAVRTYTDEWFSAISVPTFLSDGSRRPLAHIAGDILHRDTAFS